MVPADVFSHFLDFTVLALENHVRAFKLEVGQNPLPGHLFLIRALERTRVNFVSFTVPRTNSVCANMGYHLVVGHSDWRLGHLLRFVLSF